MCQRLVCQKREFTLRSSSCEVYDPKLKNSIFFRIDMKHSYFSNYLFPINFSVLKLKINSCLCMFLMYKVTNLTLYMYSASSFKSK